MKEIKNKVMNFLFKYIKKSDNTIIKRDKQEIIFIEGEKYLPSLSKETSQPLKITNLEQYRNAIKEGITEIDFSDLNVEGEDIQNLNLNNLNLDINLRNIFVPYDGSFKFGNSAFYKTQLKYGDCFLHLEKANLQGNNVTGNLHPFYDTELGDVYFWYNEHTFDEEYKRKYPEHFLDENAPSSLKNKFYNPKIVKEVKPMIKRYCPSIEITHEEVTYLKRQTLDFQEFIKNYEFLKDKCLDNFEILEKDCIKINIIKYYGLEKAKQIFLNLSCLPFPIDTIFSMLSSSKINIAELDILLNGNAISNFSKIENDIKEIEEVQRKLK